MSKSPRVALFAVCLLAAFLQGWIILKVYAIWVVWLLYLGIAGAIPFLILNGPHGDAEGLPGIAGGILYVLTNGAVYYWIVSLVLRLRRRRQQHHPSKSVEVATRRID